MKEQEIRPQEVFDEYIRLAERDAAIFFGDQGRLPIVCPACGGSGVPQFSKHGFAYQCCPVCDTLFVSPRPPAAAFQNYYRQSESARYFATTFYRATADARREKLWRPKAERVWEGLRRHGADTYAVIDIGGGYGIFAEEFQAISGRTVTVIEPGPELADICRDKGLNVVEDFLEGLSREQLPPGPKAFVSFELFEHLHDPGYFLERLRTLMSPGDLFFFTTLSGTGLDIQVLWEASKSVSLQHLNFFNPGSARRLLEGAGFEVIEVATPGALDVDILFNNRNKVSDRFWRTFLNNATLEERNRWQKLLAESGWSSHMSVICRLPELTP
jgi:hypothetical protein